MWGEYEREDKVFGTIKLPVYVIDYHQTDKLIVVCPKLERFIITSFNEVHQPSEQSDQELDILPALVFDLTVQCTPLLKDERPFSSSCVFNRSQTSHLHPITSTKKTKLQTHSNQNENQFPKKEKEN